MSSSHSFFYIEELDRPYLVESFHNIKEFQNYEYHCYFYLDFEANISSKILRSGSSLSIEEFFFF